MLLRFLAGNPCHYETNRKEKARRTRYFYLCRSLNIYCISNARKVTRKVPLKIFTRRTKSGRDKCALGFIQDRSNFFSQSSRPFTRSPRASLASPKTFKVSVKRPARKPTLATRRGREPQVRTTDSPRIRVELNAQVASQAMPRGSLSYRVSYFVRADCTYLSALASIELSCRSTQ